MCVKNFSTFERRKIPLFFKFVWTHLSLLYHVFFFICWTGEVSWSTTEEPFTPEEEDAIVTLVVVVIGIIIAIVILFSMGIFIDCKHQYVIRFPFGKFFPRKRGNRGSIRNLIFIAILERRMF